MKRVALALLLTAAVAMAGCLSSEEEEQVEADSKADVPVVDGFATFTKQVDGHGQCTFAVVMFDDYREGRAGITLVGCTDAS